MGMFDDLRKQEAKERQQRPRPLPKQAKPTVPPRDVPPETPEPAPPATAEQSPATERPVSPVPQPSALLPTPVPQAAPEPVKPADAFDLTQLPFRKHSCLLTPEEFNALDELKVALRKQLGGTVSKESLTRCAIHYMIEDFRRHGDSSPVLAPLKKLVKEW